MLLILLIALSFFNKEVNTIKDCANCRNVKDCPQAIEILQSRKLDDVERLKAVTCGFDGDITKVCCSELDQVYREAFSKEDNNSIEPSDIGSHPNLGLLPRKCGSILGNKIIGGSIAEINEFPWMALISYSINNNSGQVFKCAGALINQRYVLTAAHCISKDILGIRLGEHDTRTKIDCEGTDDIKICGDHVQDLEVEKFTWHNKYKKHPYMVNDIGLIRLLKPANLTSNNVAPICLPIPTAIKGGIFSGRPHGTVAGWGQTENLRISPILRKVNVPVATYQECLEVHNGDPKRAENKICAGQSTKTSANRTDIGKDASIGDSGAPLMVKADYYDVPHYIAYGIVSYGRLSSAREYPGVYTDVTKYIRWILDNIEA